MTRGVHRVTPDSKAGRRMTQAKGARVVDLLTLTREQTEWNAEVERRKSEKKAKKQ